MNKTFIMGTIALSLALSGCATNTGSFLEETSDTEVTQSLVKNVTTKEAIKYNFGEPEEISFDRGYEKWIYSFKRSEEKGVNFLPGIGSFYQGSSDIIKHLEIIFNARGVLEKYTFSSSQGTTRLWFSDLSSRGSFQRRNHGLFSSGSSKGTYNSPTPAY